MAITRNETTQFDWQQGTLSSVMATESGDLVLSRVAQDVLSRVGAISLNSGENSVLSMAIDTANGYLYAGTYTAPAYVVKIRLNDFTRVGAITLASGEDLVRDVILDAAGGYLYASTFTSPAKVVKIRLSDFTRVGAITLASGEDLAWGMALDTVSGNLYVSTYTAPAKVVKIRLSDFTRVGAITLAPGEDGARKMAIDAASGYLYVGTHTSPGRVIKVRLNDFTRVGAITLNSGEKVAASMALDTANGYLYVGTYTSPAYVVKIRLSDFVRVGSITLSSGEDNATNMVMDTASGYLYVVTHTSPGRVIKVRLNDFTRVGSITLNSGEDNAFSAALDASNRYIYIGTNTSPAMVVKVSTISEVYATTGYRISPPLDLSERSKGSKISWTATVPAGTALTVETSLDGGVTWSVVTSGGAIPGLDHGLDLTGKSLLVRVTLSTQDTTITPQLHEMTITVYQLFERKQEYYVRNIYTEYSIMPFALMYMRPIGAEAARLYARVTRMTSGDVTIYFLVQPYTLAIEWVPLGVFWSLDWDSPDDTLEATVTARDRLELLRKSTYHPGQVQQNVSLYTLAEQVLVDAGLKAGEYWIDPVLQQTVIPWAWLSPTSHREALRIIAEAALAVVYADRDGVIRIEAMGSVPQAPVLEITADDYFPPLRAPSRQESVANEIVVTTQPLRPAATAQEVYRSTTPISVQAGQTVTVQVKYNQPPVIEAAASLDSPPAGVSIVAATYYAWGATVSISNTSASAASVTLVITGKPLSVQGGEQVIARDEQSIRENGALRYEFPSNPLVQTLSQAQAIANALLASAKDPRRDIEVEWRGNPALELGDRVTIVGQDVHVIRQAIEWAGALTARLTGRKVT